MTTQARWFRPPRSPTMRGSAVETTSWSSIAMMSVSSRPGSTIRISRFGPVGTPLAGSAAAWLSVMTRAPCCLQCAARREWRRFPLTCRPASIQSGNRLSWLLTGRQVGYGNGGRTERARPCQTTSTARARPRPRHPVATARACPAAVRRAGLREDLAAGDRRAARRHQGRAVLLLQVQGRHRPQPGRGLHGRDRRADRLGQGAAAHGRRPGPRSSAVTWTSSRTAPPCSACCTRTRPP